MSGIEDPFRSYELLATVLIPGVAAGYFVIDSSTHTRWLGLTKDEFDARCKALGIAADLEPPSHLKR